MNSFLSVCMIVKDEENNIRRCFESIYSVANEIIVVDTGSKDNTKEIARTFGAKVYDFQWVDDFSKARNYSIEKASGNWILIMDADDELDKNDSSKILDIINNPDSADVYMLNTVCYYGDLPGNERVLNVSIRLFRNKPSLRYEGRIHEHISIKDDSIKVKTENINIYHYGYLNSVVEEKNKRNRNMRILEKQLAEEPDNPYYQFCMGNEYTALNNPEKALEYYIPAYNKCRMTDIYVPKLIFRIVLSYQKLKKYEEALMFVDEGLKYYPNYTDLEYLRGNIFHETGKLGKAIKSFEKCLSLGDPPPVLSFIIGVGGYLASYALGNIYHQISDLDSALKYYNETLKLNPKFYDAIYKIGNVITSVTTDQEEIKKTIEQFFPQKTPEGFTMLADIMFCEKQYTLALNYINMALEHHINNDSLVFLKGQCLYHLRLFQEAIKEFTKIPENNKCYIPSLKLSYLCFSFMDELSRAEETLNKLYEINAPVDVIKVYSSLNNLFLKKEKIILSESKDESEVYLPIILEILDSILSVKEFDKFETALELFNCITNDDVLLFLSKLYYKHGFYDMSTKEIIRSIKLFDKIDVETSYILYKILSSKSYN
ncbi:glycosyl transferase [Fervidicella metallireducens AeB]|uniref:Glycosyl transferase n=1 Tax=Fervidicella metallireducens AeB TaxID=1403537 RepID=A0A017RY01_9CLOT|nr:TPR domain-containing glycosyltransferase [Fervidicella metallireducens]EYE89461.1 glycosyl transferase [Fervidicella metallireducens AeB]